MGLNDYFRRNKPSPSPGAGEFWSDVTSLCAQHVPTTIEYFRGKRAPRLDWAVPRWNQLIEPIPLHALIEAAKKQLTEVDGHSVRLPMLVQLVGSWCVHLTVFPSEVDADFLQRCKNQRFEDYVADCRATFRLLMPSWDRFDYAMWLLFLRQDRHAASIHLYADWSFRSYIEWIAEDKGQAMAVTAPLIAPVELYKDPLHEAQHKLFVETLEAYKNAYKT